MKLVDIVGARPQFIKVGPILRAIEKHNREHLFRALCVTLRDETEWVETVESGRNVLAGCDHQRILDAVREMRPPSGSAAPYGDGLAGERIVSAIIRDAVQRG